MVLVNLCAAPVFVTIHEHCIAVSPDPRPVFLTGWEVTDSVADTVLDNPKYVHVTRA